MLRAIPIQHKLKYDGNFTKTLDRVVGQVLRQAIRAWLKAVLNSINSRDAYTLGDSFPIKTGEAKGSLMPLGRALRVAMSVNPKPGEENKVLEGESQGKFYIRDDKSHPLSFKYRFNFSTGVVHFQTNEKIGRNNKRGSKTPWKSLEAGDKAFHNWINSHLQKRINSTLKTDYPFRWVKY